MTWYELSLRRYDANPATGDVDLDGKTMSHLESDDESVIAATMRCIADRLDPPKPPRGLGRDAEGFPLVHDPVRCRGDACDEGHTYAEGCLLRVGAQGDTVVNAPGTAPS